MAIPSKLPKPSKYARDEVMTEADWARYYELREKTDRYVSQDDKSKLTKLSIISYEKKDWETYKKVGGLLPLTPSLAIAAKDIYGIKSVQEFNLYEAKQRYPDEF